MFDFDFKFSSMIKIVSDIKKQVDYANVRAVNKVLLLTQDKTVNQLLPKKFTLRTKWWQPRTRFGFNIAFAKKDNPEGTLGSRAPWLKLQEEGGTKTPTSAQNVALPTRFARTSPTSVLTKKVRPKYLFSKGKAFVLPTRVGPEIFVRQEGKIVPMYMLRRNVHMRPILEFVNTANKIVADNYQQVYDEALKYAFATAR